MNGPARVTGLKIHLPSLAYAGCRTDANVLRRGTPGQSGEYRQRGTRIVPDHSLVARLLRYGLACAGEGKLATLNTRRMNGRGASVRGGATDVGGTRDRAEYLSSVPAGSIVCSRRGSWGRAPCC